MWIAVYDARMTRDTTLHVRLPADVVAELRARAAQERRPLASLLALILIDAAQPHNEPRDISRLGALLSGHGTSA